jgi:hypothetical protein
MLIWKNTLPAIVNAQYAQKTYTIYLQQLIRDLLVPKSSSRPQPALAPIVLAMIRFILNS